MEEARAAERAEFPFGGGSSGAFSDEDGSGNLSGLFEGWTGSLGMLLLSIPLLVLALALVLLARGTSFGFDRRNRR